MLDLLHDWNPWWGDISRIVKVKGIDRRSCLEEMWSLLEKKHILTIAGIRRAGKTTLIYQTIERLLRQGSDVLFINADDERLVGFENPLEAIITEYNRSVKTDHSKKTYVFADEIQNFKGWEKTVKRYYDQGKDLKFVVTGSSSSLLRSDYSTLLTGRSISMRVDPLSFPEYLDFKGVEYKTGDRAWENNRSREDEMISHLEDYMRMGGFPEVVLGLGETRLLDEYFRAIIYRDIVSRNDIRNPEGLELVALYLLRNLSNIVSLRSIAQSSGLTPDTVSDYMGYLERAFMIRLSQHFARSTKEQLRQNVPMKVYATDLGMANAMMLEKMDNRGRWAENIVANHLSVADPLRYWREDLEVDILIPTKKQAYQVCYGDIRDNEIKALSSLPYKGYEKYLITRDRYDPSGDQKTIPLWSYLLNR